MSSIGSPRSSSPSTINDDDWDALSEELDIMSSQSRHDSDDEGSVSSINHSPGRSERLLRSDDSDEQDERLDEHWQITSPNRGGNRVQARRPMQRSLDATISDAGTYHGGNSPMSSDGESAPLSPQWNSSLPMQRESSLGLVFPISPDGSEVSPSATFSPYRAVSETLDPADDADDDADDGDMTATTPSAADTPMAHPVASESSARGAALTSTDSTASSDYVAEGNSNASSAVGGSLPPSLVSSVDRTMDLHVFFTLHPDAAHVLLVGHDCPYHLKQEVVDAILSLWGDNVLQLSDYEGGLQSFNIRPPGDDAALISTELCVSDLTRQAALERYQTVPSGAPTGPTLTVFLINPLQCDVPWSLTSPFVLHGTVLPIVLPRSTPSSDDVPSSAGSQEVSEHEYVRLLDHSEVEDLMSAQHAWSTVKGTESTLLLEGIDLRNSADFNREVITLEELQSASSRPDVRAAAFGLFGAGDEGWMAAVETPQHSGRLLDPVVAEREPAPSTAEDDVPYSDLASALSQVSESVRGSDSPPSPEFVRLSAPTPPEQPHLAQETNHGERPSGLGEGSNNGAVQTIVSLAESGKPQSHVTPPHADKGLQKRFSFGSNRVMLGVSLLLAVSALVLSSKVMPSYVASSARRDDVTTCVEPSVEAPTSPSPQEEVRTWYEAQQRAVTPDEAAQASLFLSADPTEAPLTVDDREKLPTLAAHETPDAVEVPLRLDAEEPPLTLAAPVIPLALESRAPRLALDGRSPQLTLSGREAHLALGPSEKMLTVDAQDLRLAIGAKEALLTLDARRAPLTLGGFNPDSTKKTVTKSLSLISPPSIAPNTQTNTSPESTASCDEPEPPTSEDESQEGANVIDKVAHLIADSYSVATDVAGDAVTSIGATVRTRHQRAVHNVRKLRTIGGEMTKVAINQLANTLHTDHETPDDEEEDASTSPETETTWYDELLEPFRRAVAERNERVKNLPSDEDTPNTRRPLMEVLQEMLFHGAVAAAV